MTDMELLDRIVTDSRVMVGKPVVRGTRLTVDHILNRLGHGDAPDTILADYDYLHPEDVRACILFASRCMESVSCVSLAAEPA